LKQEQKIKDQLEVLEQLEIDHISDRQIMKYLRIDEGQLKSLREMLREKHAAIMGE
jgi:hypothetical protein